MIPGSPWALHPTRERLLSTQPLKRTSDPSTPLLPSITLLTQGRFQHPALQNHKSAPPSSLPSSSQHCGGVFSTQTRSQRHCQLPKAHTLPPHFSVMCRPSCSWKTQLAPAQGLCPTCPRHLAQCPLISAWPTLPFRSQPQEEAFSGPRSSHSGVSPAFNSVQHYKWRFIVCLPL